MLKTRKTLCLRGVEFNIFVENSVESGENSLQKVITTLQKMNFFFLVAEKLWLC